MKREISVLAVAALLTSAVWAHHSTAMFDNTQVLSVEGEVEEWYWSNPHSWLRIYAPYKDNDREIWGFESTATQLLLRQGFRRTTMKPGDRVRVDYNPFKDGSPGGNMVRVHLSDGTVVGQPERGAGRGRGRGE